MWEVFIEKRLYPTYILEFLTAFAGIFYLLRSVSVRKSDKFLVYLLIFLFIADLFGILYAMYGYVYDFKFLDLVKGTPFEEHWWIPNIASLVTTTGFATYFTLNVGKSNWRKIILAMTVFYLLASIGSYFLTDSFFTTIAPVPYVLSAFLICFSIVIYYLDLLRTNRVLNFKSELAIYISFGLLIYKLAITPLFIFQRYIRVSSDFENVYGIILDLANVFLYSIFIYGFIKQSRKENPLKRPVGG
ncbi:hypothetical protein E0K83_14435 [Gramella sp. BOM4]|nr:hypothetical protein [Christiangramia bathymodioli]